MTTTKPKTKVTTRDLYAAEVIAEWLNLEGTTPNDVWTALEELKRLVQLKQQTSGPLFYALGKVSEEAGEITQAVEKIKCFGLSGRYPDGTQNLTKLQDEITDLMGAVEQVNLELIALKLSPLNLYNLSGIRQKMIKIHKYSALSIRRNILRSTLQRPSPDSPYFFGNDDVPPLEQSPATE